MDDFPSIFWIWAEINNFRQTNNFEQTLLVSGRQYGFDIAGWKATDLTGSECNLILEGSSNERHLSLDSSASKNGGNCKLGSRYSPIYFQLPNEFVGNKIFSYGLSLSFELKPVGDITQGSFVSRDLIIEGKIGNDLKWIAAGLNWQNNPVPTAHQWTFYSFRYPLAQINFANGIAENFSW